MVGGDDSHAGKFGRMPGLDDCLVLLAIGQIGLGIGESDLRAIMEPGRFATGTDPRAGLDLRACLGDRDARALGFARSRECRRGREGEQRRHSGTAG